MRLRKKQGLRIVSSVLAASMVLSAFPTAAFAVATDGTSNAGNSAVVETQAEESQDASTVGEADTLSTLKFENGIPVGNGNKTSGWSWDGYTLTLYEGYEFNQDVEVNCRVYNYGTITAGTFKEYVYNAGKITDGLFADGVSNYIDTYSSADGNKRIEGTITGGVFSYIGTQDGNMPENTRTLTGINSTINDVISDGAYIVGENQKVIVTFDGDDGDFESWKVISGDLEIADSTSKTIEFTMPANDVWMRVVFKDRPLVIGEDGKPTCSGGKNWEYRGEDTSYKQLFLYDGCEFAPENTVTCMVVVYPGATIQSGTFDAPVVNLGTIKSGTFNHEVRSAGVIENGAFNDEVGNITFDGIAMGGEYTEISKCEGVIKDGTFNKKVANGSKIEGGTFKERVTNVTVSGAETGADMTGEIAGGTFENVVVNFSTIKNGTFNDNVETAGTILGGNFNALVQNANVKLDSELSLDEVFDNMNVDDYALGAMIKDCPGLISGGTFNGAVDNAGMIEGGEFKGTVTNKPLKEFVGEVLDEMGITYTNTTEISDGTFWAEVQNYAEITGGDFKKKVTNVGEIDDGVFENEVKNTTSQKLSEGESQSETVAMAMTEADNSEIEMQNGTGSEPKYVGIIKGGIFTAESTVSNESTIVDGSFAGTVENASDGEITGGSFTGAVASEGTIANGSFTGEVKNTGNGQITGGDFTGKVENNSSKLITGGTFVQAPVNTIEEINLVTLTVPADCTVNGKALTTLTVKKGSSVEVKYNGTLTSWKWGGVMLENAAANPVTITMDSDVTLTVEEIKQEQPGETEKPDSGKTDTPSTDKTDSGSTDTPSTEKPDSGKTDTPSTEKPDSDKTDTPSTDKTDSDKTDTPSTEKPDSGKTDTPSTEKPDSDKTDTPSTEKPDSGKTDTPSTEKPDSDKTDTPSTDKTDSDKTDTPSTEKPDSGSTDTPSTDKTDSGKTDTPSTEKPDSGKTDTPSTDKPDSGKTDTPSADKTDTDKPNTENPANNDSGAGALVVGGILVAGGVATGVIAYNVAMDYIKSALPEGVEIPETREQLAVALWENAGKPEVAVAEGVVLTDTEKAVRWAVEKQLISAEGGETVSKLDVLKAVYQAKKL